MTNEEKIDMLKVMLDIASMDDSEDSRITAYLNMAEKEILAWRYSYATETPQSVPAEYEMTQLHAVVAGFAMAGAQNQTSDVEGVIHRTFKYEDMIAYIRGHVIPIVRCI